MKTLPVEARVNPATTLLDAHAAPFIFGENRSALFQVGGHLPRKYNISVLKSIIRETLTILNLGSCEPMGVVRGS